MKYSLQKAVELIADFEMAFPILFLVIFPEWGMQLILWKKPASVSDSPGPSSSSSTTSVFGTQIAWFLLLCQFICGCFLKIGSKKKDNVKCRIWTTFTATCIFIHIVQVVTVAISNDHDALNLGLKIAILVRHTLCIVYDVFVSLIVFKFMMQDDDDIGIRIRLHEDPQDE